MSKFRCENCKHSFSSETEVSACPRCSSRRVFPVAAPVEVPVEETRDVARPSKPMTYGPEGRIYGETKGAWKSFHGSEQKNCIKCGGAEFDLDWKHKEKTCRKCGEIFPLPRRSL